MTQASSIKLCKRCRAEVPGDATTCPYDGAPLEAIPDDPLIGKVFAGKYEIESILGRGGMSIVYRARDVFMERVVAIKILHTNLMSDNTAIQRFRQEAQAAGGLNHPNIMTVYDFGLTAEDQAFLVMELFDGPTLAEILENETRITPDRTVRLARQICDGLDHAHKKGIVHRDLKPSNLCIVKREDGKEMVKIVDFGIAKFMPQEGRKSQQLTQTGQIFGSPLFMSPEQCTGKSLDARTDIYSLGCLLYEALTGAPPFMGDTAYDTMTMHINEAPTPLRKVAADANIPELVQTPVMKCLQKKPEDRYQSAADMKDDLPPLGDDPQHTTTQWAPTWYSSIRYNREARVAVAVGTTILLCAIPCLLVFFYYPGPDVDQGTLYDRLDWGTKISTAEKAIEDGHYAFARRQLEDAEFIAKTKFNETAKEILTLNIEARLGSESGDFKYAEDANIALLKLYDEKAQRVYESEMSALDELRVSNLSPEQKKKSAQARVGRIETAVRELAARQKHSKEEKLLLRALEVDKEVLGPDHPRIAELDTLLAECYMHVQNTPPIKGLLSTALNIWQTHLPGGENNPQTIKALLRLGEFERDQSDFEAADKDLKRGLDLAGKAYNKNKNNADLLIEAYNSYADYLKQTHKIAESGKYFELANKLMSKQELKH
ncbi:MAG TPA: protein kinase [Planktothrix sp.]|jgi:serine/threonine protein kinase